MKKTDPTILLLAILLVATIGSFLVAPSIAPPLIATFLVLGAQYIINVVNAGRRFGRYAGEFDAYDLEGRNLPGKFTIVHERDNVLEVFAEGTKYGDWKAKVIMNRDVPNVGEGAHEYQDHSWLGHLRIQYRESDDSFAILATDKSLGKESRSAYHLRRHPTVMPLIKKLSGGKEAGLSEKVDQVSAEPILSQDMSTR